MSVGKAKLLVNFGGEFTRQLGKLSYVGGKTRLVLIERFVSFEALRTKMTQLSSTLPSCLEIRFQLPDESLESRLVSVECDDDVFAMMSEFEASQRIPVYIFDTSAGSVQRSAGPAVPGAVLDHPISTHGDNAVLIDPLEFADAEDDLISLPRVSDDPQTSTNSHVSPATSDLVSGTEPLAIGQEFPTAQAFRDVLIAIAISLKFELTFIRSDRARVTAKCAADGCSWRVHASKLPDIEAFRIKTLKGEHSCTRPELSSHRQASMKWILSCILDRVRANTSYKPKEIMRDIEQEYGVMIPYLKAHRAKERALELIYKMPIKDIVRSQAEVPGAENVAHNYVSDQQRKRVLKGSPVHCNLCKRQGHNRRSCLKFGQNESRAAGDLRKNFHCMLCKQNGHNRRTCLHKYAKL